MTRDAASGVASNIIDVTKLGNAYRIFNTPDSYSASLTA